MSVQNIHLFLSLQSRSGESSTPEQSEDAFPHLGPHLNPPSSNPTFLLKLSPTFDEITTDNPVEN